MGVRRDLETGGPHQGGPAWARVRRPPGGVRWTGPGSVEAAVAPGLESVRQV